MIDTDVHPGEVDPAVEHEVAVMEVALMPEDIQRLVG